MSARAPRGAARSRPIPSFERVAALGALALAGVAGCDNPFGPPASHGAAQGGPTADPSALAGLFTGASNPLRASPPTGTTTTVAYVPRGEDPEIAAGKVETTPTYPSYRGSMVAGGIRSVHPYPPPIHHTVHRTR